MRRLQRFRSHCRLIVLCAVLLGKGFSSAENLPDTASEAAEHLVFLLQYVGTDYAGAVKNGAVVDESEYREMTEFALVAVEEYQKIRNRVPPAKAEALAAVLTKLRGLIGTRADPAAVRAAAESAIPALIESFALHPVPKHIPVPERAASLYAENCTPCHGANGRGDGPRAKELDPRPANFTDPTRIESVAPYVFYNAITFGVPKTAMASFRDALTDEQRWDLAFFLWTFSAPRTMVTPTIVLSLRDLATRSSGELAPDVIQQATNAGIVFNEAQARTVVADLRAHPRALVDHQERLARVRQDLLRSLSLLEQGDLESAADLVTTSYLNEFEPLEPEIDRVDPSIRRRFEDDLVKFRSALRRGDRKEAAVVGRSLGDVTDAAAQVLAGHAAGGNRSRIAFFTFLAVLLVTGAVVILLRRRFTSAGRGVGKRVAGG